MTSLRSLSDLKTLFGPEAKARDNKNGAAAEAGRRKEVAMLSNIQCGSQIGNAVIEGHTDIPASPLALIQDGAVRLTAAQAGAILRLTRYERQTRDLNPAGRDHILVLKDIMVRDQWRPFDKLDFANLDGKLILINGHHRLGQGYDRGTRPLRQAEGGAEPRHSRRGSRIVSLQPAHQSGRSWVRVSSHRSARAQTVTDLSCLGRGQEEGLGRAHSHVAGWASDLARSGVGVGALEHRSGTGRGCEPGNRTQSRASGLRAVVHEILHPQARHGGDRKSDQVADSATCSFADATAKATGRSARTVRVVAERGNKISDRALQLVAGTHLDTGTFLDKIKDLGPKEQEARVQRELAAERPQRRPVSPAPEPRNEIEAFEAWLARGVKWFETGPEEWRERAREHLYPDVPVMDRRHA